MNKPKLMLALLASAAPVAPALAQSAAGAHMSATRYDASGRVAGTISADPDGTGPLKHLAVRNTYDSSGNLAKVETGTLDPWQSDAVEPKDWTGFTPMQKVEALHDLMGRKTRETASGRVDPLHAFAVHSVTEMSYDELGRLRCTAVRMNLGAIGSAADACSQGSPAANGDPDRITRNHYDNSGRLERVERGVGTAFVQDHARYSFSPNGEMRAMIDADGNRSEMTYDGHGRQKRLIFPAAALAARGLANPDDFEEYTYDANGSRTKLRTRAGEEIAYAYDALARMTAKDRPGLEPDIAYEYDLRGLQTKARFTVSGEAVTNEYDGAGRLTASSVVRGAVTRRLEYGWDLNGGRSSLRYPDGRKVSYARDGLDRITEIRLHDLDPEVTATELLATYRYDLLGRRDLVTRAGGSTATTAYAYDGAGRLASLAHAFPSAPTKDVTIALGYNAAGQIVSRTVTNNLYAYTPTAGTVNATANGLNQLASMTGATPQYDARGNMTRNDAFGFGYSSDNLMTGIGSPGGTLWPIPYDPLGRLVGDGNTTFLSDPVSGNAYVSEDWSTGFIRYIPGPGVDEPMMYLRHNGVRKHFFADERGSVIAVDEGAGLVTPQTYDEYGKPGTRTFRFGYTGQAFLTSDLYYFKARLLWSGGGRFLQTDPTGHKDGPHLYAYSANDPINRRDPFGLASCPEKGPCPDVPLPPKGDRDLMEKEVGRRTRGNEKGGQLYISTRTGERRPVTGKEAGRATGIEFQHRVRPKQGEKLGLLSHAHTRRDSITDGARGSEVRRGDNTPSDVDQAAMHQTGVAVQTIGNDVTTTLYREDRQDRLRVDSGDRDKLSTSQLRELDIELDPNR